MRCSTREARSGASCLRRSVTNRQYSPSRRHTTTDRFAAMARSVSPQGEAHITQTLPPLEPTGLGGEPSIMRPARPGTSTWIPSRSATKPQKRPAQPAAPGRVTATADNEARPLTLDMSHGLSIDRTPRSLTDARTDRAATVVRYGASVLRGFVERLLARLPRARTAVSRRVDRTT
jgi:hypothetical protein